MTSTTFFIIFIPILSVILLAVNLLLAPHNPYQEKDSVFECGFHSFLGQNRTQFSVSFFVFGLLFLLFDLEIVLIYPYSVSSYSNDSYGLGTMLLFFGLLTLGFIFELGKGALSIDSKQTSISDKNILPIVDTFITLSSILSFNFLKSKNKIQVTSTRSFYNTNKRGSPDLVFLKAIAHASSSLATPVVATGLFTALVPIFFTVFGLGTVTYLSMVNRVNIEDFTSDSSL